MLVIFASIFASIIGWGGMLEAVEFDIGNFTLGIHGFLSQGYLKSDHNNFLAETEKGTFEFREYGVNASSYLTDQLRVGAQLFGRDFGDFGNDEIVLDWGFADYRFQDWLGLRAGRMKVLLGMYNETRDIDMVRTSVFLSESIYNDGFRESFTAVTGLEVYGTVLSDRLGSLSYQLQWGKLRVEKNGGISKYILNFFPMEMHDVETSDVYLAGVELNPAAPLDGLRLRATWNAWDIDYTGTTTSAPFWSMQGVPPGIPLEYHAALDVTVLSAEYRWRNLVVAAETFAPANYANSLKSPLLGTLVDDAPDKVGYYASVAYGLTDWLELGVAYSEYYNNEFDKDGELLHGNSGNPKYTAWLKDWTLSTRFDFAENWVVKLEGHIMDGADILLIADNPDGIEEHWFLFGGKVTYNF